MKEKTVCFECGVVLTGGNSYTLDGNTMCEECFERLTTNCDNCSTRIWRDNAEGDSNYILCHNCYEYSYTTCEDCGRLRFHDLRHTSCTLLLSEGISMKTLQKRLGHSDYRTTADIYSHVLSSDEMIASCIADDIVFSKMG